MTALARPSRGPEPRELDVRCSAGLPRAAVAEGRCQLFAGHDGPHAVMFTRTGERTVRLWGGPDAMAERDADQDALQRPWMFGYPAPAWFETDPASDGPD